MGYPKWKYSPGRFEPQALDGNGVIVRDPDEEARLGPGWYDSPAEFVKTANKPAPEPASKSGPVSAAAPLPEPARPASPGRPTKKKAKRR